MSETTDTTTTDTTTTDTTTTDTTTTDTTTTDQAVSSTPPHILCRVVDVEFALLTSFRRFVEEQKASLEDLMNITREELTKMELFSPKLENEELDSSENLEELKLETT